MPLRILREYAAGEMGRMRERVPRRIGNAAH